MLTDVYEPTKSRVFFSLDGAAVEAALLQSGDHFLQLLQHQ